MVELTKKYAFLGNYLYFQCLGFKFRLEVLKNWNEQQKIRVYKQQDTIKPFCFTCKFYLIELTLKIVCLQRSIIHKRKLKKSDTKSTHMMLSNNYCINNSSIWMLKIVEGNLDKENFFLSLTTFYFKSQINWLIYEKWLTSVQIRQLNQQICFFSSTSYLFKKTNEVLFAFECFY